MNIASERNEHLPCAMIGDFDLAWTEPGEAWVSCLLCPHSCEGQVLMRSLLISRHSSVVTRAAWNRMSWKRALLITFTRIVYESQEQCGPWWVFGFLFCFAFCSWKNSLLPDLPGAADKESRSCLCFRAGFQCAVCLWGQLLTSGSCSDLLLSPISFSLPFFPSLPCYFFLFLTFPSSPPPLLSSFPFFHPSIHSFWTQNLTV